MTDGSIKNPEGEAENPAPMPRDQQGQGGNQGGLRHDTDPEGQQGGTEGGRKPRMAPRHDAPPGLEQDSKGNTIPLSQRTQEDQEKARAGRKES